MKNNKNKVIIAIVAVIILAAAFFCGTSTPDTILETEHVSTETILQTEEKEEIALKEKIITEEKKTEPSISKTPEENEEEEEANESFCYISVNCSSVLENLDKLKNGKEQIIPPDGIMLKKQKIILSEGESVFDILLRTTREKGIHLEFVNTPMFNSAYIEGIGNLYEFDCGDYSGWTYSVNGVFPTYGSSQYKVGNGDVIELIYVCNMLEK